MNHDDDELFAILERAIGPTSDDAPTDAERQQLRATVDDVREHRPVPITVARPRRWIRRTVATGLGGIVVLSGATAVAAAANDGVLPAPARAVARSIGLPVESSDLASARAMLGRLRRANDDQRDAIESEVLAALNRLSAGDLAKINDDAAAALERAHERDEQLSANAGPGSSGSDSGSGSSGSGSSGSSGSGSGSSGSGSSGSDSSGSSGSGSGGGSSTSSTLKGDDHGGSATTSTPTSPSTSTTVEHSDGDDATTSTSTSTANASTSTTDGQHGDGDGGGGGGGDGGGGSSGKGGGDASG